MQLEHGRYYALGIDVPLRGGELRYAWWRELTWYKYLQRLRPISRRDQRTARYAFGLGEAL